MIISIDLFSIIYFKSSKAISNQFGLSKIAILIASFSANSFDYNLLQVQSLETKKNVL